MKKIIFMGTPEFAVPSLEALIKNGFEVALIVTQPDRVQGRKRKIIYSPVKEFALENNIPLIQPYKIKDSLKDLYAVNADLIITAAYGQILPKELLDNIKAINVHGSLLPLYRGGAPIQYALFDGLAETGVTIMDMAFKMDSGDIIKQGSLPILEEDNYETLSEKLSHLGAELLIDVLNNDYPRIKQVEEDVTFAFTLKREDEFFDFSKDVAYNFNRLKGLLPNIGGAFKINDTTLKVYKASKSDIISNTSGEILIDGSRLFVGTKDFYLEILEIQAPGKRAVQTRDFLNGQKIFKSKDLVQER